MRHYYMLPVNEESPYIIHENTMCVMPFYNDTGVLCSQILEVYKEIEVKESPSTIVARSIDYFGGALQGRLQSAGGILIGQKLLPVMISEKYKTCMVPTCSPAKPENSWISYKHVRSIVPKGNQSIITLTNYSQIVVDVTRDTMERRLDKAARLLTTYEIREEKILDEVKTSYIAEPQFAYNLENEHFDQMT
ncbi:competence protein ComK [Metabacillus malikii]|uniref:Competence protein ComK n=1 Tax=Metabacillus malikii TaxID=1504265 RepID=A0ABT9ZGH2_9BACI|nr:competence protein ComK [Metabacillus malikii]MDQ0231385.1 competence protein ComK [Metabacillus malikii]